MNTTQIKHAVKYIKLIHEKLPMVPVVVGGPHVSAINKKIFQDFDEISFAIVGEGERAIVELLEYMNGQRSINSVTNLLYRSSGHVICNPIKRITDLNALPLPDYSLVEDLIKKYHPPYPSIARPSLGIICTRGCFGRCTFCSSPITWGGKITFRSTDSVLSEVLFLKKNYDVKEIFFEDDTLNARPEWFIELCEKLIAHNLHKNTFFKCPMRVDEKRLTLQLLKTAKRANFWMIFYGVESGCQRILDKIKKETTKSEITRAFDITRKAGLYSYASMMIGNMGENEESVSESIRFVNQIKPDFGGFGIAFPFPGTELYEEAERENLIIKSDYKNIQYGECILKTKELSCARIQELAEMCNKNFPSYWPQDKLSAEKLNISIGTTWLQDGPIQPGEMISVPITIHNHGLEYIVTKPAFPVYLSYHWSRDDGSYEIYEGIRTSIDCPLLSGESRLYYMQVKAPSRPMEYILKVTLVQENVFWFENMINSLPYDIHITVK